MADRVADEELEKRKRRLEKNRDAARESRKRKRDRIETLRQQLTKLETENIQLRLKLKIGTDFPEEDVEVKDQIPTQLETMLQTGAPDAEIRAITQQMHERYSDFGMNRRTTLSFHLSQLRRCLQPTQTTRTILWLMSCAPQFHTEDGEEIAGTEESLLKELWQSIMLELNPTPPQKRQIYMLSAEGCSPFPRLQELTENSNSILDRLEELVCNKNESLDNEMQQLQATLNPRQVAYISVQLFYRIVFLMHMLSMLGR
jgi:hypothetical protein